MRYTLVLLSVLTVSSVFAKEESLAEKYSKYANARRYCVSRIVTPDGRYRITTWHRNGRPDWILPAVETNEVVSIVGKEQNNPLQDAIVKLNEDIQRQLEMLLVASNRYVVAEARIANAQASLDDKRAEFVEKRDKAALPTTKAIYQAFIDVIDDIKAKLNALLTASVN